MNGWIKLHRSIIDHWIFQDEKKLKWWLTILLEVNYQDRKVLIGNRLYACNRGESIRSLRTWAKKLNTTPETIRHFLFLLQKDGMIKIKNIGVSTHLTICNYDIYQSELDTIKTALYTASYTSQPTEEKHDAVTNNKVKKANKEISNKGFLAPTLEEVISYFELNGYKKETAAIAFKYYQTGNWKDRNGQQVKNWKQKMTGVWFKEENRKVGQVNASFNSGPGK